MFQHANPFYLGKKNSSVHICSEETQHQQMLWQLWNSKQSLNFLHGQCKIPYHRSASSCIGNWVHLSGRCSKNDFIREPKKSINSTNLDIVNLFPELRIQSWKFAWNWWLPGISFLFKCRHFLPSIWQSLKSQLFLIKWSDVCYSVIQVPVSSTGNIIKVSRMQFVLWYYFPLSYLFICLVKENTQSW